MFRSEKGLEHLEQVINIWVAEQRHSDKTFELVSVTPTLGIAVVPLPTQGRTMIVGNQQLQEVQVKTIVAVAASVLYKIQVSKE